MRLSPRKWPRVDFRATNWLITHKLTLNKLKQTYVCDKIIQAIINKDQIDDYSTAIIQISFTLSFKFAL